VKRSCAYCRAPSGNWSPPVVLSPAIVNSPLSLDTLRLLGSKPGANATVSTVSSVQPTLIRGKVPTCFERRLVGKPPNRLDLWRCSGERAMKTQERG
jgi:hypothetical protein